MKKRIITWLRQLKCGLSKGGHTNPTCIEHTPGCPGLWVCRRCGKVDKS
jgi:hypothetical protein